VTPGRLAEVTGLTTGAITGVIDRRENAGFVARLPDPADRRRTIVQLLPGRTPEVADLFSSIGARLRKLCSEYTAEELALVLEFMERSTDVVKASAAELRDRGLSPAPKKRASQ